MVYLGLYQDTEETSSIKSAVERAIEIHLQNRAETEINGSVESPGAGCITAMSEEQSINANVIHPAGVQEFQSLAVDLGYSEQPYDCFAFESAILANKSTQANSTIALDDISACAPFYASDNMDMIMAIGFDSELVLDASTDIDGVFGFCG